MIMRLVGPTQLARPATAAELLAEVIDRQGRRWSKPEVAQAFYQLPRVTKAVAGVGFWGPGESTLHDAAEERDRQAIRRLGVRADISGVFLSADGEPAKPDLTERMIGINAEQMRAIPEVVVIAFGMAKLPAMRAVLRSGLVSGVVTHTALAQALLDVT